MSPLLKKKNSVVPILILAFLIPFVITCAALFIGKMAPFGDTSLLIWDAKMQYKDYFCYLWDVLHGNASLDYSASKSLGGPMIGLVTYYLTCPLNLLVYFFKKSQISIFFSMLTVLKISFSGLTSSYFIKKRYDIHPIAVLILSTSYAMMEYNVYYSRNIMWLDGVVMLPLVCLGVYELLYKNRKGLLLFSVPVAIISNWYSGYMVCLMAGLYFLFELALKYDYRDYKNVLKKAFFDCVRAVGAMLVGVMISAVVLLPACMSLIGGKAEFKLLYTQMNFSLLYLFSGFDINASVNSAKSPILYCGGIAVVLVVYLFFDKRIKLKTRIAGGVLFAFVSLSFVFKQLEMIWTAFVRSNSYNYRFAFVFAFVMIMLSAITLREIQNHGNKINKDALKKAVLTIGAIVLLLDLTGSYENRFVANIYAVGYAVYAVLALLIFCGKKKGKRAAFLKFGSIIAAVLLLASELGMNSLISYKNLKFSESRFENYVENTEAMINELKAQDPSFYRFEKNHCILDDTGSDIATCEALMYGYNSIEHYSSTYDPSVDKFLASMGYSDSTYIPDEESKDKILFPTDTYWNSPILLTDSLLGVKYYMCKDSPQEKMNLSAPLKEGYNVYKNQYALGLAYNVSRNIEENLEYGLNPFENQQKFLSAVLGEKTQVYVSPETSLKSFSNGVEKYTITAKTDGPMYFYSDGSRFHDDYYQCYCLLYVNGERVQKICGRFNYNVIYIGNYKKGETVDLVINNKSKKSKERSVQHEFYTAQLDMNAFETAIKAVSSSANSDLNIKGNTVSGTYTTDTDSTVMLTIPYSDGWQVYIDGEKAYYKNLAGTFIGIDLTAGTHTVEMKYKTQYINLGVAVTAAGLVLAAVWLSSDFPIKKRKNKN